MSKRKHFRRVSARACAAFVAALAVAAVSYYGAAAATMQQRQGERVDIRLRSLTTRATGQLTIEASEGGGRGRLTAMNLPDPRTVAADARTYVVWAVSGGRIVRVGELRRDERGNGGLAFDRPEGLERYGIIVTAEATPEAERPGDPVLTTRADEAAALYPTTPSGAGEVTGNTSAGNTGEARAGEAHAKPRDAKVPVPPAAASARTRDTAGDFYAEVEDALVSQGGGRVIELEGDSAAPNARGAARATLHESRAYVRANFRGVPLPQAVGASVYVLWGVIPDGRIVYMGSLPATEDLNRAEVYVRVAGFDTDDYTLFVTAERQRPAPSPDGRRLLKPKNAVSIK
ncbi:MAG: hypothetical protein QOJ70_941 [Acidobacteriota bacterium]|jgi:hypothetical protein|nr:hypothetical protein [Acidobacteriota bacterium]